MTYRKLLLISVHVVLLVGFLYCEEILDSDMKHGIESYKNKDFIDTIFYMDNILEKNNSLYSEALFWKAKSHFQLKHYMDSKDTLELFLKKGSITSAYYEDARFLYCKIFFMLQQYEDSILLFNQYERNSSFNYYKESIPFWVGECYLQLSNYKLAKEYYEKYLLLKPDSQIAKNRIKTIENIVTVLEDNNDYTVMNKAKWFSDYVYKEQISSGDKSWSDFISSFNNRDDFFNWMENNKLKLQENLSESTIIKEDVDILSELESLLKTSLGDD